MKFYKYQGAGNDFLIADNRDGHITEKDGVLTSVLADGTVWSKSISGICDRRYGVGADGLMLLDVGAEADDFRMTYFNSDGSGGMMCGNGGRCMVAFARDCGVEGVLLPDGVRKFVFTAADGPHEAYILNENNYEKIIRLRMKDVQSYDRYDQLSDVMVPSSGYFLDTGTRHYVRFVKGLDEYDIVTEGRQIRYSARELQPVGANVNYVEQAADCLMVRTYEKGVEDETFACGTGIVASAVAAYVNEFKPYSEDVEGRVYYPVKAKRDSLSVDFIPGQTSVIATDVFLTGPAAFVAEVLI